MQLVDKTQEDLTALIEKDFGPLDSSVRLDRLFLDWLHYKARAVPARKRNVIVSQEVQAKRPQYPTISEIETRLRAGLDLRPWMSDSIRRSHSNPKADMLFNDWQICHFHLGGFYQSPNKIKRTRDILLAYVTAYNAVLLLVVPHGRGTKPSQNWTAQSALEVFERTVPSHFEHFQLKGVAGLERDVSADEMYELRRAGVNSPFMLNGKVYFSLGMGVVTSGHALRLSRYADQVALMIRDTTDRLSKGTLPPALMRLIHESLALPVQLRLRYNAGQFILSDENRSLDLASSRPLE